MARVGAGLSDSGTGGTGSGAHTVQGEAGTGGVRSIKEPRKSHAGESIGSSRGHRAAARQPLLLRLTSSRGLPDSYATKGPLQTWRRTTVWRRLTRDQMPSYLCTMTGAPPAPRTRDWRHRPPSRYTPLSSGLRPRPTSYVNARKTVVRGTQESDRITSQRSGDSFASRRSDFGGTARLAKDNVSPRTRNNLEGYVEGLDRLPSASCALQSALGS